MELNFDKLNSKDPSVKYGFAKELLNTSKTKPSTLYNYFDNWIKLLSSENNILKWTAIDIIGYLSAVDKDNKFDKVIPDLLSLLHGGKLITSNHAVFALGLIAQNKPEYKERVLSELLSIAEDSFETEECKNIVTGKVLDVLKSFKTYIRTDKEALAFIQNATSNSRNSTRKRAEVLSKKLG